jgi:hypothetical protein
MFWRQHAAHEHAAHCTEPTPRASVTLAAEAAAQPAAARRAARGRATAVLLFKAAARPAAQLRQVSRAAGRQRRGQLEQVANANTTPNGTSPRLTREPRRATRLTRDGRVIRTVKKTIAYSTSNPLRSITHRSPFMCIPGLYFTVIHSSDLACRMTLLLVDEYNGINMW